MTGQEIRADNSQVPTSFSLPNQGEVATLSPGSFRPGAEARPGRSSQGGSSFYTEYKPRFAVCSSNLQTCQVTARLRPNR
ncbi:hypothetical protein PoB_002247600 [Plakobranchus ocellatus]|uniref:Uncharacterized protein n=1 Tax=Plakobranchus ocellatus TaxID=259542 RepID=A0AAV3ZJ42_9GAST|nr:hypothetical protein PoB_002247600 [Plakobranchus ocellatus]